MADAANVNGWPADRPLSRKATPLPRKRPQCRMQANTAAIDLAEALPVCMEGN